MSMVLGLVLLSHTAVAAGLEIEQPWIRAMPPGSSALAGYMVLENQGASVVTIVGAESPLAGHVSLHRSQMHDGMSHMQALDKLVLKPGNKQVFAPGGLHLMLNNVTKYLLPGDKVPVCLVLASGRVCKSFLVLKQAP